MEAKNRRKSIAKDVRKITILHILDESGPQSFGSLESRANLYPATLNVILDELEAEGKIEKIAHKGKLAYAITKKGKGTILEFGIIGMLATQMMQEGAVYQDDYSNWRGTMYYYQLPWGIQDDLVLDRSLKKKNPITKETASELQKTLYRCIKEDYKKKRIQFDSTKDGKIILGLMINYKDLINAIEEQSMDYLDIRTEREDDLLAKWEDGTLSEREKQEWENLRKITRVKLRGMRK